jgi:hypothetical protein
MRTRTLDHPAVSMRGCGVIDIPPGKSSVSITAALTTALEPETEADPLMPEVDSEDLPRRLVPATDHEPKSHFESTAGRLRRTDPVRELVLSVDNTTWMEGAPDGESIILAIQSRGAMIHLVMPHVVASDLRQALNEALNVTQQMKLPIAKPRKSRTRR